MSGVCVYYLLDPRNGRSRPCAGDYAYVGYTSNARMRRKAHFSHRNLARQSIATCWMRSLFAEHIKPVMLTKAIVANVLEAKRIECALISALKSRGVLLANGTDGGDGGLGRRKSDEERQRIGEASRARRHSPETRARISAAKRNPSEETRARLRLAWIKRRERGVSTITRARQSAAHKGRPKSWAMRSKLSAMNKGRPSTFLGKRHSVLSRARMSTAVRAALAGSGIRYIMRAASAKREQRFREHPELAEARSARLRYAHRKKAFVKFAAENASLVSSMMMTSRLLAQQSAQQKEY